MVGRCLRPLALLFAAAGTAAVLSTSGSVTAASCEIDGVDRIVAVGDVHGAYDRFLGILRVAGIVDDAGHWSGGRTHFVQVGDMVDRGDDSRKVLDFLRRLEREAERAGGRAHVLLGNHEAARMLGDLRLTTAGEYAAFAGPDSENARQQFVRSAGAKSDADRDALLQNTPLGWVEMRQAFGREGDYGKWLRERPVVLTIDGFVFVHGGISSTVAPLGCEAINAQVKRELTSDLDKTRSAPLSSLVARVDGPLWYRGLADGPDSFAPQVAEILIRMHAKAIVVAHTVTPTGRVTTRFDGRVIEIDTGMQPAYVQNGRASALEIRNGDVTAVYADRRDPVAVGPHP
jgi:hypothetical protein